MSINFLDVRKILPRNVVFQLCRKKELHKLPVFLHPITVAQHVTRHQCTTKHHHPPRSWPSTRRSWRRRRRTELGNMKKLATTMVFSLCLPCGNPQKRYENLSFCGLVQQPHSQPAQKLEFINNASGMIPMISPLDGEKYLVNSDGFYSGFHRVFEPTTMGI